MEQPGQWTAETTAAGRAIKISTKMNNKRQKRNPSGKRYAKNARKSTKISGSGWRNQHHQQVESLSHMQCDDDVPEMSLKKIQLIRKSTDYKAMVENLIKDVEEGAYFTKTLSNNTVIVKNLQKSSTA
jgi:hypothetical protein